MKNIELIEKALLATIQEDHNFVGDKEHIKSLLEQLIRANMVLKKEKFDLSKICNKTTSYGGNLRPSTTGIFHENGLKLATDGNCLCAIQSKYDKRFEGKIITPGGEIITNENGNAISKFPDWKKVVPDDESLMPIEFTVDTAAIKQEIRFAKINGENLVIVLTDNETKLRFISTENFLKMASFINAYKAKVYLKRDEKLILAKANENIFLMMVGKEENANDRYFQVNYHTALFRKKYFRKAAGSGYICATNKENIEKLIAEGYIEIC